jgi:uncharacterized protein YbjQ (UPF0145 family)
MELIINLSIFLVLLGVGLFAGRAAEQRHYRELKQRELLLRGILVFSEKRPPQDRPFERSALVTGSVVIAEDYFKGTVAGLKSLFGGNLTTYESLLDRGRREAIVRMKQQARQLGASMVFNVKLETASLGNDGSGKSGIFSAEFIAYGTALIPPRAAAKLPDALTVSA